MFMTIGGGTMETFGTSWEDLVCIATEELSTRKLNTGAAGAHCRNAA